MSTEDIKNLIDNTQHDDPADVAYDEIEQYCIGWPEALGEVIDNVPLVSDIIQLTTQDSEVDPMAVLTTLLVWFGAAVGSNTHVNIGDIKHPPRIFAVLVGASSRARKGTSELPIRLLFEKVEEISGIPKLNITYGPLASGEGLIHAVRDPSKDPKINDQGIVDKRLLCIEQEFANVFKILQRDGSTLSCVVRRAWDGGTISPLTKHNNICATNPHICMLGHITEPELSKLLNNVETWNGFANRFLWVCVQRKKLIPLPTAMDKALINSIANDISEILKLARTRTAIGFTQKAKSLWVEKYPLLSQDLPGRLGALTARAEAHTLRIAELFTLIDGKNEIDLCHLQAALAYWQYCSDSVKFLFGNSFADPNVELILRSLKSGSKTTSELHKLFNGHIKSAPLQNLLRPLLSSGKIKSRKEGGGRGKGKPVTNWELVIR